MEKRIVFCLIGMPNSGKSSTIGFVAHIIKEKYGKNIIYENTRLKKETYLIIKVNGMVIAITSKGDKAMEIEGRFMEFNKKIGIVSKGDRADEIKNSLKELRNEEPTIILCASRERKDGKESKTEKTVIKFCKDNRYGFYPIKKSTVKDTNTTKDILIEKQSKVNKKQANEFIKLFGIN